MNQFLLAIQFLTIIPVRTRELTWEGNFSGAIVYFPLVGFLLGLILAGLNSFLSSLAFNPFLINVILVCSLAILTGALHLDGLADTFDAFSSGKDRQATLEIMRDPHIGTMGVLSLISVILLKIAVLSSLGGAKNISLIIMCVLSRWSLMLPIHIFDYARVEGKAKVFFLGLSSTRFILVSLVTLLFSGLIWNWKGLVVFTAALVFSYSFSRFVNKKISGMTGDTLGATLELNEVLILLICLIIYGA